MSISIILLVTSYVFHYHQIPSIKPSASAEEPAAVIPIMA